MGPELAMALMAAGTGAQMISSQEAADQRRGILNGQLERDKQSTGKAIDLTQQEAQRFNQDQRVQGLQQQEAKVYDQTQQDLAGGANLDTAGGNGNVSTDFLKTKAQRAVDEGNRLTAVAREAAKSRAPGMLSTEDSLNKANLAGSLQNIFGTNANMGRATGLDADSVTEPAYGALGKIASSLGTAGLAGSIGQGAYGGTSLNPTAANYENSFDLMNPKSGIQFAVRR